MTPVELRNSILKLAIEGKLTTQNFNDDSNIRLKSSLVKAKEELIAKKMIKKEKTIEELNDVPFDIPDNWFWIRTGDCVSNRSGLSYNKENLDKKADKMIRVFRGGNISDLSYLIKDDDVMISHEFIDPTLLLRKNWIITPAVTSLEHVGKMARIEKNYDNIVVGGFVLMLIPHIDNDVFSKYLLYAFSSGYYRNLCKAITNKSGQAFYNLSREKLMNIYIPLPPLEEQERIVAKIEELLPLVDRYEDAWSKLEKLNKEFPSDLEKSILQYAIQGKLVKQMTTEGNAEDLFCSIQNEKNSLIKKGIIQKEKSLPPIEQEDIPFEIPSSWKWCRWGELSFSIQYGYNASARENGRIRMVRISDIQDGDVLWNGVPFCDIDEKDIKSYLLEENDILFARTGGTVGKSFLVKKVPYESVYAGYLIRTRYSKTLVPEYLKAFMGTKLYWDQLHDGTIATAQPNCNGKTLSKMLIPLPPREEQIRIVNKLKELLPICKKLVNNGKD